MAGATIGTSARSSMQSELLACVENEPVACQSCRGHFHFTPEMLLRSRMMLRAQAEATRRRERLSSLSKFQL